ncbi:MAG: hypothetical protein ACFFD6_03285 [Candidatus Thorarchaeota archaeon]
MAIDYYKIDSRNGVLIVTLQKGTIIYPDLLIEAIDSRYSIDETCQRNSVWDFRGCPPIEDFGYDAMKRVFNYIENHPAAEWDLRQAILVDAGVQYDLSRMYQIIANSSTDIAIFINHAEAMKWSTDKKDSNSS